MTDIHHDRLDDGKHKKSVGGQREKQISLPKECPAPGCSYLKPAGVHKCPSCGFAPERQSPIETKDGNLVQLNGRRKGKKEATPHSMQEVYSMLLWVMKDRGKNMKFVNGCFYGRYGGWPPKSLRAEPIPPDASFINWLKSQLIRHAKRREKDARNAA